MQAVTKGSAWRVSADDVGSGFTDYDPYYRDMDDVDEVITRGRPPQECTYESFV
jgi:hypothetical protein